MLCLRGVLYACPPLFLHRGRWGDFLVLFNAFLPCRELGALSFCTDLIGILRHPERIFCPSAPLMEKWSP